MKKNKNIIISIIIAVIVICGAYFVSTKTIYSGGKSVGIIMPAPNAENDGSFGKLAFEAYKKAKTELSLGDSITFTDPEKIESTSFLQVGKNFVSANKGLIFGVSFTTTEAIKTLAEQNSKTNFVLIDGVVPNKNVISVTFKEEESSYLAGFLAARESKTGKVGFVGGIKSDLLEKFQAGFIAGAKKANANIKVSSEYIESFTDQAKGRTVADKFYSSGIDVIYVAAGGGNLGVFESAKESTQKGKPVYAIGVDSDQYELGKMKDGKSIIIGSALKKVDVSMFDIIKKYTENKLNDMLGKTLSLGLKEDGVDIKIDVNDDKVKSEIKDLKEKIINGSISIPKKL